jgi:hypothetical protein
MAALKQTPGLLRTTSLMLIASRQLRLSEALRAWHRPDAIAARIDSQEQQLS